MQIVCVRQVCRWINVSSRLFNLNGKAGRLLLGLLLSLPGVIFLAKPAVAQSCSAYSFTLTNGTTADASQVMANFNAIMTCANSNLAHNGANSDITSLSAATSIHGLNISSSTGTLSIANGKTATFSNTLTLAGTDGTTLTFPPASAVIARTDAGNTLTGNNQSANTSGWALIDSAASASIPTLIPNQASTTTGWGAQASGNISGIIAGAEEFRLTSTGINNAAIGQTTPAAGSFTALQSTSISGSTQCIHADASGHLSGTGADCGTGTSGSAGGCTFFALDISTEPANAVIQRFMSPYAWTLPTAAHGGTIALHVDGAPAGDTDFVLLKNGSSIGTIHIVSGSNTGTLVMAADASFAVGDYLDLKTPITYNGMSGVFGLSLLGARS